MMEFTITATAYVFVAFLGFLLQTKVSPMVDRGPEVLGDMASSHAAVYNVHRHGSRERTRGFD